MRDRTTARLAARLSAAAVLAAVTAGCAGPASTRHAARAGSTSYPSTTTALPIPSGTNATTSSTVAPLATGSTASSDTPPTSTTTTVPALASTTPTTRASGATRQAMARSGGMTVTLSVSPDSAAVGATVDVSVSAQEASASGALGYTLSYGDGSGSANEVPQFCRAGPGRSEAQTWYLTHAYRASGSYSIVATVYVNCGSDRASTSVPVTISG